MQAANMLLTIACYGAAIYLWWRWRTPLFFFALLAGHITALDPALQRNLHRRNVHDGFVCRHQPV